jgi:AraC-like DNA-binding protein
MMVLAKEHSTLWKSEHLDGVELLKASYHKFEFAKHWHDELAIGIIEKGAEGLNYRGSNIVIPENQIVAINPSEVHTGFSSSDQGWDYRMFYFDPHMIESYFLESEHYVDPFIESPILDDPQLFQHLLQLHLALEQPSLNMSKETLMVICFELLFERYGNHKGGNQPQLTASKSTVSIRNYLLENWQDNVTLAHLESFSGHSKFQLIRNFTAQYGLTPHQFLLLVKVNKAKRLLLKGMSCADSALECGFFDQSHLSRNFKRAFGVSPSRYVSV